MPIGRPIRLLASAAVLCVALCAAPLRADPDITVTGQRLDPEQAHAQAMDYVRKVGIATGLTPAARWIDPVCVEVLGVEPAIADLVAARFRAIATRAGARLGRKGCRTNALIAFSADGANYVRKLEKLDPRQFEELTGAQRDAVRNGKSPVRWWYRTGSRGTDGEATSMAPPLGFAIEGDGDVASSGATTDGGPRQNVAASKRPSLIATSSKREIKAAAVVVDVNLASGRQLSAIGEYAALVLLAEVQPLAEPPPGSILSLFAPDQPRPDVLTVQDEALLKALYALPLAREARFHRGKLVDGMTKAALGEAK